MAEPLDILDTQVLVYCANDAERWASEIYDDVLAGERVVYLPRYVTTEFYQVMERSRGQTGANVAWEHLTALWDAPAAVVPHPNRFRVDVESIRHHATTRTLAAECDVQPKDAPILAAAYRIAEFVETYDPPQHSRAGIPNEPEEFALKQLLNEAGVDRITSRIVTHDGGFGDVDFDAIGLDRVTAHRVP